MGLHGDCTVRWAMCVCRPGHWCPKVSASVMSVTGRKAVGVGEAYMHVHGILASRVRLHGAVAWCMETLP